MAPNHPYPSQPIRIVHLAGTNRQMGRQHAEQVRDAARLGMVKVYHDLWTKIAKRKTPLSAKGVALRSLQFLLDPVLTDRLIKRVPASLKERIEGMSEVAGIPFREGITALVLPDLLPMLQAFLVKFRPSMFIEAAPYPQFGCSSFVASGKAFLHGRNLDFPGVAYWDRYPVIQSFAPTGKLRYVGFGTAGVPFAGITGVNEAQISVSLHQHYCVKSTFGGVLPFALGEEILQIATDLDSALSILRRSKVSTAWAFIVTDGKRRSAFIAETNPTDMGVRFLGKEAAVLAHSNYFQTLECKPSEYATSARMNWDNYWRKSRLESNVIAAGEGLDFALAAQALSEHFDPVWGEEKVLNRTVSQAYNIQSIVLDPERMRVAFAEGDAPIHLRHYRELDLGDILAGGDGETGILYPAYQFKDEKKRAAKQDYILSFVAAFDDDEPLALARLYESLVQDFCPEVAQIAAMLELKRYRFQSAKALLERARECIERKVRDRGEAGYPPEYFEISLYLARTCELLNERHISESLYKHVAGHPELADSNIRRIATKGGPYTHKHIARLLMPYSSYIPFG